MVPVISSWLSLSSKTTLAKGIGCSSLSITSPLILFRGACWAARWLKPRKKKNEAVKINLVKYMVLALELFKPIQRKKGAKTEKVALMPI
jgi:hypothetical protein